MNWKTEQAKDELRTAISNLIAALPKGDTETQPIVIATGGGAHAHITIHIHINS